VASLAKEVIAKCKLIHPSKQAEVEQLIFYLQNRKEKVNKEEEDSKLRAGSASMHRLIII
jgi:hypothetical protein